MKKIELTRGLVTQMDDNDFEWLLAWEWRAHKQKDGNAYAMSGRILMHRLLVNAELGQYVDHIDGDGLNNQRDNLRLCSHLQNCRNRKKCVREPVLPGYSHYAGVSSRSRWHKEPKWVWMAGIYINGKYKLLGTFENELDAAKAYDNAALEFFGEFANLNFGGAQGYTNVDWDRIDRERIPLKERMRGKPAGWIGTGQKAKRGLGYYLDKLPVSTGAMKKGDKKNRLPRGVIVSGRGFRAMIMVNRHPYHLGTFDTKEDAARAYDAAARKAFGSRAITNYGPVLRIRDIAY